MWAWITLGAVVVAIATLIAKRRRRARFLDGMLRHLQGQAPPPFMQRDPDLVAVAVDAAADGFAGLARTTTDADLLAQFATAERRGVAPDDLIDAMCDLAAGGDDPGLRRAIILCATRADCTNMMPRRAFRRAFDLVADDPRLLRLYADRMPDCMAANPYLYLDMPDAADLRDRAARIADDAARQALLQLAQRHAAAVARALQDAALSATTRR